MRRTNDHPMFIQQQRGYAKALLMKRDYQDVEVSGENPLGVVRFRRLAAGSPVMYLGAVSDTGSQQLDRARRLLGETFGHSDFRGGQAEVVGAAMGGRNLLVVMPTGSGKSLLYQLPALLADGLTLVVSPLIALMKDQVDELRRKGAPAALINSSLSPDRQREVIEQCLAGRVRLLYVAPERFRSSAFVRMLEQVRLVRLAVDEAHCISEWGHDFRPDYRRIKDFRRQMGDPPTTALTATATPRVQQDIIAALGLTPDNIEVHVRGFDRPNLKLCVVRARTDEAKVDFLRDFLRRQDGSGIIYVGTRKAAEEVSIALRSVEPSIAMYHAGLEPEDRTGAQEAFLTGKARVAVATVAFGMGIDKADVRFVAHYHFPGSIEQYYQEIGRAGRDGKDSQCVLLYSSGDRFLREFFIDLNYPSRNVVKSVMDAVYEVKANPVMLTYRQIAASCSEDVKDGQVGPSLRLLAGAGIVRPLEGAATATVELSIPGAEILKRIRGKNQQRVFESLAVAGDLETPGELEVDLAQLARAADLNAAQVQRALAALDDAGLISYHPPFRGRGVEKLMQRRPVFEKAAIDWKTHEFLRSLEEEKLQQMEAFIRTKRCRRGFIVEYFGEAGDLVCGDCDTCRRDGGGAIVSGVMGRHPQIAAAVLVCVANLQFPLGVGRIAQVVTGSRDSKLRTWGLQRNPAYGAAACSQDAAKEVVDHLVAEHYLRRTGEYDRPVLELTDEGAAAAEQLDLDDLRPLTAPDEMTAGAAVNGADIREAALRCVRDLPTPVGIGRVAEVLTGSNAKWIAPSGADQLDVYNCVRRPQSEAKDAIRELIGEGLLTQNVRGRYPVLELTGAGLAALADDGGGAAADEGPTATQKDEAEGSVRSAGETDPAASAAAGEFAAAIEQCVQRILTADKRGAADAAEQLRLAHPARVAEALASALANETDPRNQARAVWAAGRLCGAEAIELLLEAASSSHDTVREQAARGLGKVAARVGADAVAINRAMPHIHQSLQRLLADASPSVAETAAGIAGELTHNGRIAAHDEP